MRLVSSARIEVAEAAPYFLSTVGLSILRPSCHNIKANRASSFSRTILSAYSSTQRQIEQRPSLPPQAAMANNGKPTFSFGSAAGASTGQSPFASFGSTTPSTSSPFGAPQTSTAKPAGSTGPSLFGNLGSGTSTIGSGSTAGSQTPSFGGAKPASNPASGATTPNLFGSSTGATPGGMFGSQAASSGTTTPGLFGTAGGATPSFGGAGGFKFGQAKDNNEASTPANNENKAPASGGLFGGNASKPAGSSLFNAASSGTITPAKPAFSFANSTTPAGPPPTVNGKSN